jgi:hypothetical protein
MSQTRLASPVPQLYEYSQMLDGSIAIRSVNKVLTGARSSHCVDQSGN